MLTFQLDTLSQLKKNNLKLKKDLITIGITCFNSQKSIKNAIFSALRQTWRPIEIIIIDDCSSDNGFQIIKELADKNDLISYFRNKVNKGVAYSRNKIIKNSKGKFIAFFDSDDVSLPTRLSEQYFRILEYEKNFANGCPVICHTARKIIYQNSNNIIENTMGENLNRKAPAGIMVAKRILFGNPLKDGYGSLATCSQMSRLNTYKLIGGFDNKFRRSEDTELSIRLALNGTHFVGIKKVLVLQHMTKIKEKNYENEVKFFEMVIKKHKELMNNKQYEFALKWINIKYIAYKNNFINFIPGLIFIFFKYPMLSINRFFLSLRNLIRNLYIFNFYKK